MQLIYFISINFCIWLTCYIWQGEPGEFLGTSVGIGGDTGDDGLPGLSVSAKFLFYHCYVIGEFHILVLLHCGDWWVPDSPFTAVWWLVSARFLFCLNEVSARFLFCLNEVIGECQILVLHKWGDCLGECQILVLSQWGDWWMPDSYFTTATWVLRARLLFYHWRLL